MIILFVCVKVQHEQWEFISEILKKQNYVRCRTCCGPVSLCSTIWLLIEVVFVGLLMFVVGLIDPSSINNTMPVPFWFCSALFAVSLIHLGIVICYKLKVSYLTSNQNLIKSIILQNIKFTCI